MEEAELIYNLFYILISICIIYPPTEFISIGLTIEQIFANFLGSETLNFIRYHQKLTSLKLAIHGSLPAIYFIIHYLRFPQNDNSNNEELKFIVWKICKIFSFTISITISAIITYWYQQNWKYHPISKLLICFSNSLNSYESVAINISDEFRRPDILNMNINPVSSVIATENWIIKTSSYTLYIAHQSDTTLEVIKAETYDIAVDTIDRVQMVNIMVKPLRRGVRKFQIRINALDFKTLQDRISRPITIPSTIRFHQNITDRFVEVFKEHVSQNNKYKTNQNLELCFACMIEVPNIKIQKQCLDVNENGEPIPSDQHCRDCYCRPMWCVDCLAKWFVSRQNEYERDVWLGKKCTCPLCRATFCILDVCYLELDQ